MELKAMWTADAGTHSSRWHVAMVGAAAAAAAATFDCAAATGVRTEMGGREEAVLSRWRMLTCRAPLSSAARVAARRNLPDEVFSSVRYKRKHRNTRNSSNKM